MRIRRLLPHVPIAIVVIVSGLLNLEAALRRAPLSFAVTAAQDLGGLNGSLNILGRGAQGALGGALVLLGIGLVFRLRAAWAFSLLIAIITVAVNLGRHQYGASLVLPGIILISLVIWRDAFVRRTAFANIFLATVAICSVLAYGFVGAQLLGAGFRPAIADPLTALYFTIVTLSTVGYGDIVPVTWQTRTFTMTLILGGIGIFATSVASLLGPAISGELTRIFSPEKRHMPFADHVIVVGSGPMADNTVRELAHRHVDYVRVVRVGSDDANPDDERIIVGDPTEEAVLRRAGIAAARMIVAAREDDNENAFVSLLAKDLNPKVQVLAIAVTARGIQRLKLARADVAFAPSVVGGRLVANLVQGTEIPPQFADLLAEK